MAQTSFAFFISHSHLPEVGDKPPSYHVYGEPGDNVERGDNYEPYGAPELAAAFVDGMLPMGINSAL